jgi:Caspase domain
MAVGIAQGQYLAPNDHAIIVGINRYRTGVAAPLNGAVNDAKLFREWAIRPDGGGLNPDNVTLILSPDNGPFVPSRDEIETEIRQFYERGFETGQPVGRRLYLFMAGHGIAPPDGNDCSLITANSFASPYWVVQGGLTADRIRKQPFFEEVVLFMACCRDVNGSAPFLSGLPEAGQPLQNSKYLHGMAVKWAKRAIEKELPNPFDRAQLLWQSVFSHALIKGLMSAIDDNGEVTSLSLKNFVRKQVQALLPPDDNRPPDFALDDTIPPIVFREAARTAAASSPGAQESARHAASGLTPVEINAGAATDIEVLDGASLNKLDPPMEKTATGTVKVYLKPGLYVFRAPGQQLVPVRVLGEATSVTI